MHVWVPITMLEFCNVVMTAVLQRKISCRKFPHRQFGTPINSFLALNNEIIGVMGEVAYQKWSGRWGSPKLDVYKDEADCFEDVDVRTINHINDSMIVRPSDVVEGRRVVLAHCDRTDGVTLLGWMYGEHTKDDRFKRDPRGIGAAWFIPQSVISPMNNFKVFPVDYHLKSYTTN